MRQRLARYLRLPVLIAAALACLATPAQRFERNFPAWTFDETSDAGPGPDLSFGCAAIHGWVSKSGKEGMGVSFELQNVTRDLCTVSLVYAAFVPEGLTVKPETLPPLLQLTPEERQDGYVGFVFDNEALWNEGRRLGVLHLTFNVQGDVKEFRLPLTHRLDGFQRQRFSTPRVKKK